MRQKICFALVAVLAVAGGWVSAQEPAATFIIEGIPADLEASVTAAGGNLLRLHPEIGYAVAVSSNPGFAEILGAAPGVDGVEQDLMVQWTPAAQGMVVEGASGQGSSYDPTSMYFYPCQWNLDQIDAAGAWDAGVLGDGVTVAVLDSGIDPYHQELSGKVDLASSVSVLSPGSSLCNLYGYPDEETIFDFRFHGTLVASQITGNGIDMAAVAPGAEIVAVKVLNCLGSGSFADVIAGILYAASLPDVDIINMSLGAYFPKNAIGGGELLSAMNAAVNYATSQGKLVVAAAGNDYANLDKDTNYVSLPAQAGTSMGVYATNFDDQVASYSNYGRSGTWVGAPGGDGSDPSPPLSGCVLSQTQQGGMLGACSQYSVFFACYSGPYWYLVNATGTSFAAPTASGVAALIDGNYGGALNAAQLKTGLKKTADDLGKKGSDALYSHGRVNAGNAAQY